MKKAGIIENSDGCWSCRCLLVPKPNGSYRFCTDYRKVNAMTVTDNFPFPRIGYRCGGSIQVFQYIWFSERILASTFISFRAVSAFVTPQVSWQYRRMAFGMKNTTATFQRLSSKLVQGIDDCAVYLDDIVQYNSDYRVVRAYATDAGVVQQNLRGQMDATSLPQVRTISCFSFYWSQSATAYP